MLVISELPVMISADGWVQDKSVNKFAKISTDRMTGTSFLFIEPP